LKQRIALRCQLLPLTASETAHYVATRLRTAGGSPAQSFTREAIHLIHQCSRGIPRTINVICDNALLSGFAAAQRPVNQQLIRDVCRDYDFETPAEELVPARVERPAPPVAAETREEDRKLFGTFGRQSRSWFSR
jgi:general secretion pathway protein A